MIGSSTAIPRARILRSPLRASADIELSLHTPPARFSSASSAEVNEMSSGSSYSAVGTR